MTIISNINREGNPRKRYSWAINSHTELSDDRILIILTIFELKSSMRYSLAVTPPSFLLSYNNHSHYLQSLRCPRYIISLLFQLNNKETIHLIAFHKNNKKLANSFSAALPWPGLCGHTKKISLLHFPLPKYFLFATKINKSLFIFSFLNKCLYGTWLIKLC